MTYLLILKNKFWHTCALAACSTALVVWGSASAQTPLQLEGKWRNKDGSATVKIDQCKSSTDLCATVIEEKLAPGETSALGEVIVRDIRKDTNNLWKGKFADGKSTLAATITVKDADNADFKICALLLLCETQSFSRIP
jgi:uncharacterized protein (DUF2147 family)